MSLLISDAYAQAAGGGLGGGGMGQIVILVVFVAVFYFLLIRPQQKRMKEQQAMLSRLASGDEVVTTGGILGRITEVGDTFITLEIADGVRIKVQKTPDHAAHAQGHAQERLRLSQRPEFDRMLEFPRWKYVLVALVMLIGLLLALPNVFGEDPALQVERKDRAPMDDAARQAIEELLHKQQRRRSSATIIDGGRLILAFDDVAAQLKARDTVDATLSDVDRSALSNAIARTGLDAHSSD